MLMINCDLGECLTPNPDAQVMPLIGMANIACGGHVGNDKSMIDAIKLALKNNVKIGAHPSYNDSVNFGRVSYMLSDDELFDLIQSQVSHFQNLCIQHGATLAYIKPHGALYHDMTHQQSVLGVICKVIESIDPSLILVVQVGNEEHFKNFENNQNGGFLREVFADRGYNAMHMIARSEEGAVLNEYNAIIEQFWRFSNDKTLKIDTICFHSDNPASVEALTRLKDA
ncbi:LamB/YcsF family protein [Bathymodiolus heckerae thiotrophic gill symbiont]|uniref:LamB/YcsF family protein n=1 Tax=Bathymodiolus heckerae thiotrophic gill symbiont TaxID=1052212 RepID=UPI0010FDBD31|nr:LamB/YcsF family protein [Bathymodiolus heckerae thiotrophic gill symbiont]